MTSRSPSRVIFLLILVAWTWGCSAEQRVEEPAARAALAPQGAGEATSIERPKTWSPDAEFWSSCEGERERQMRTLACGELVVSVLDTPMIAEDSATLQQVMLGVAQQFIAGDEEYHVVGARERADLTVQGAHGLELSIRARGQALTGLVTARSRGAEGTRMTLCVDADEEASARCKAVSEELLRQGVPEAVTMREISAPIVFAGREIALPNGCKTDGGEDMACGKSHMAWVHDDPDHPGEPEQFVDVLVGQLESTIEQEPAERSELYCKIDGELGRCERRIYELGPRKMTVVTSLHRIREVDTAVACVWASEEAPPSTVPMPCALIVEIPGEDGAI